MKIFKELSTLFLLGIALSAAPSALAQSMPAPDWRVVFEALNLKLDIPEIEAVNSTLSENELRSILAGDIDRLLDKTKTWNAELVTIPAITATLTIPGSSPGAEDTPVTFDILYKDTVLKNVRNGVAEEFVVGRTVSSAAGQVSETRGMIMRDVVVFYNWDWLLGRPSSETGWQQVYSAMQIESSTNVAEEMQCQTGPTKMGSAWAKPFDTPIVEIFGAVKTLIAQAKAAEALDDDAEEADDAGGVADAPDPEAFDTLVELLVDLARSIKTSEVTVDGYDCTLSAEGMNFALDIDGIKMGAYTANAVYPTIGVTGAKVGYDGGDVSIGALEIKQIDFSGALATLDAVDGAFSQEWAESHARELIPELAGFSIANVDIDVQTPDGLIAATLDNFDLSLGNYVSGIPTSVTSKLDNLDAPIPNESDDKEPNPLLQAGIERLQISYDFALEWQQSDETITVSRLNIDAKDLARIETSFQIGNAKAELFSAPANVAQLLALALTADQLTVRVQDYGAIDLFTEKAAAENDAPPAAMRGAFSGMAGGMITGMLGAEAGELASAVQEFLQSSKPFTVTLTPKSADGLGVAQLITLQSDPTKLTEFVTIAISE